MKCPRCQAQNREGVRFCEDCGARLALSCPSCGAEVTPGKKFCGSCGGSLAAHAEARFSSPQAYTPQHLAENILTSRSALEGERKQVTVLFADLKGSMEILADRDPEEARKVLDPVLEHMMEAVHRYEGTVNQVMGDGIMALFGAPLAHEDHAVRACYTALRMHDSVGHYAEELRRNQGLDVQIRVGLNSGEVVVRSIGSDLRMDYTAVGQTTHLGARMEQLARPGTTLLTGDTLRLVEGYVEVTSLGPVPVKGLAEPVEAYKLVRASPVRSRFQAAAARGLTRFVGRDTEMEALHQALDRARAGHGQVVAVVAEPGVGKSRLFWEFSHTHRTEGRLILEAGSVSYGKTTPYLPVIDLLKAYFQIETHDNPRKIHEKVTGKLLTLDRTLEPTQPAFLNLLDVPVEDAEWQALDPPQHQQQTLDAVKRLVLRESQVQPLVIVFEDLHWIDSETQALLDNLVESLPTARLLLLVNYRPEYQHGWGAKSYYTQLRLDLLTAESAEALLQSLLGPDGGLQPLKQLLIEHTEGNPFFLEESVRTLAETHALTGERGAYRLAEDFPTIQVPATVQAVLAARIDRLPPEQKALLQTAAVIGKDVPFPILRALAELQDEVLRRGLARLQAAEFLYEVHLFPDLEYTFKHALTHEVAYGSLLHDRKRALHAQIVSAIERLYPARLAEHLEQLAQHAVRAEVWEKALAYLRQAGAKAYGRSAQREAVAYYEQALLALGHLPEGPDRLRHAIDLRLDLRHALAPLGDYGRIIEILREAATLAKLLDDDHRLGWVSAHLSNYYWREAQQDRAIELGQRALAIATSLADSTLQVRTNFYLGSAYHALGDYRRAIDALSQNVSSLEDDPVRARFGSLFWLVWSLAELGEFTGALAKAEEGMRVAGRSNHPLHLMTTYLSAGLVYLRKGEPRHAVPVLEQGFALCRLPDFPEFFPLLASTMGYAHALSGRPTEGLPLLQRAVEQSASIGIRHIHSLFVAWLSVTHLLTGQMDEATQLAALALRLAREHNERGRQACVIQLLGDIALRSTPPDAEKAEASYREAIALAEELGMRPLVARCHLGLGKLYGRTGDRLKAQEHLATATTLLRDMDMRLWLDQAEAELKELG